MIARPEISRYNLVFSYFEYIIICCSCHTILRSYNKQYYLLEWDRWQSWLIYWVKLIAWLNIFTRKIADLYNLIKICYCFQSRNRFPIILFIQYYLDHSVTMLVHTYIHTRLFEYCSYSQNNIIHCSCEYLWYKNFM